MISLTTHRIKCIMTLPTYTCVNAVCMKTQCAVARSEQNERGVHWVEFWHKNMFYSVLSGIRYVASAMVFVHRWRWVISGVLVMQHEWRVVYSSNETLSLLLSVTEVTYSCQLVRDRDHALRVMVEKVVTHQHLCNLVSLFLLFGAVLGDWTY